MEGVDEDDMQMDGGKVDNVKVAQLLIDNGKNLKTKWMWSTSMRTMYSVGDDSEATMWIVKNCR